MAGALGWKRSRRLYEIGQRASRLGRGQFAQRPGGRGKCGAPLGTRKEPPVSGAWADFRGCGSIT